jgi:hypothetical protein
MVSLLVLVQVPLRLLAQHCEVGEQPPRVVRVRTFFRLSGFSKIPSRRRDGEGSPR